LFLVLVGLTQISGNLSSIPKLNGSNFKIWKESLEILLGCMDLDLALRTDKPTSTEEQPNTANIEKWNRSNRMCLMIIRHSIPESFRGSIAESENAKKFLAQIEKYFAKNEKGEASSLLTSLTSMRYKGNGNIREYIMEMSNLASILKALNVEIKENLLVHLVLISLPAQFTQFKISYNTQKDKWSINELVSQCVQEEDRIKRERTESAHLATNSRDKKKRKSTGAAEGTSQQNKNKKQATEHPCFFYKKEGHFKKDCLKYAKWHVKKGKLLTLVCSEVNLAFVPTNT